MTRTLRMELSTSGSPSLMASRRAAASSGVIVPAATRLKISRRTGFVTLQTIKRDLSECQAAFLVSGQHLGKLPPPWRAHLLPPPLRGRVGVGGIDEQS